MPNWCYTNYKIVGESQEELQNLHEKLTTLQQLSEEYSAACLKARINDLPIPEPPSDIVDSGFNFFLGTVVKAFGGSWEKVYCRGCIVSIGELQDGFFELATETAWGEMNEVWDLVISHYETLSYYYLAEEPGNLYFVTNDMDEKYFPENYYIYDSVLDQTEYATDDESLLEYMAGTLEIEKIENLAELDKLIEEFEERNPDESLYYYKIHREEN